MGLPVEGPAGIANDSNETHCDTKPPAAQETHLLWLSGKLNGQNLDMMLDSGAIVCCLARRCLTSSPSLKTLPLQPYEGPGLLNANGTLMTPCGVVKAPLVLGHPAVSFNIEFIIIDSLPYSCILGLSFLNKLKKWGVDNSSQTFHLNDSSIKVSNDPPLQDSLQLVAPRKFTIPPKKSIVIAAVAKGTALHTLRPVSEPSYLIDGHDPLEKRLGVKIVPTIKTIAHQNASVSTTIVNNSSAPKTLGKGTKIACATSAFEEHEAVFQDTVNLISYDVRTQTPGTKDPLETLHNQMSHLSPEQLHQAKQLLSDFSDIFSVSNTKIGRANVARFDFELENEVPISTPLRRVPLHKQSIVKELLAHYKEHGLIEEIDSPYRAATLLVEKKNVSNSCHLTDRYRLVVDYRFLNSVIKDSGWPAPSLQQCLDSAAGSQFISSIDFNSGYHQIPCAEKCKPILAFSPGYGFGQWTWKVMPQGIKPASSQFQRTMEQTFADLHDSILPPFYDDVVIKGRDFSNHLSNVRKVLSRIREAGLTLNALKCKFFQTSLPYLGHIIDHGTIRIDPERTRTITDMPTPSNARSVKEFLGMAQFCDRFIPHFSIIATPLHELTQPHVPFQWTPQCQTAFDRIKNMLTTAPVLRAPESSDFFILETDACDKGEGVCLKVRTNNGHAEHIVAYASRKFNSTEANWNIVEKEAHAITFGTKKFRHYLLGKQFLLRTDNRINTFIQSKREPKSRKLLNWALELSEFDYKIHHIPSKNNGISDCLSRLYSVNLISELTPEFSNEELNNLQTNDPSIGAAKEYLITGKKAFDVSRLGPLKKYRNKLSLSSDGLLLWKDRFVIPRALHSKVLSLCHDHPSAGHFAVDRTWNRLSELYFWPNAHDDVVNWVQSCTSCAAYKPPPKGYHKEPLQPIQSTERFELVCYDLAGPFLPETPSGNKYALIIVDHFSKWPEVIPLKDIDAPTIARAIHDQWICRYGLMKRLHSDGAPNVHGCVIKEISTLLGIGKSKSSRLHPQGDGLSEAMVKQVKSCIQKQVDQFGRNWDLHLQAAVYAIRSSISSSTKVSPAELILGDKLSLPTQLLTTQSPAKLLKPTTAHNIKQAQQFATDLGKSLKQSFETVNQTLSQSRTNMKAQYDKNTKKHHYKVHDTVMLWKPTPKKGISHCWQPKWSGPWTIARLVGEVNCQLVNSDNKLSPVVHVNQLKYIPKRSTQLNDSLTPDKDIIEQNTNQSICDIFHDLDNVPDNQETHVIVHEGGNDRPENATDRARVNEPNEHLNIGENNENNVIPENQRMNENWCRIDISNILPHRTRSKSLT